MNGTITLLVAGDNHLKLQLTHANKLAKTSIHINMVQNRPCPCLCPCLCQSLCPCLCPYLCPCLYPCLCPYLCPCPCPCRQACLLRYRPYSHLASLPCTVACLHLAFHPCSCHLPYHPC